MTLQPFRVDIPGPRRFRGCLTILLVSTAIGCGSRPTPGNLAIHLTQNFPSESKQWDSVIVKFDLENAVGNPFDPDEVRVDVHLTCPDGSKMVHPAFFVKDYQIVFDHGREVVRDTGTEHWELRWRPMQAGTFHWEIMATSNSQRVQTEGTLNCVPQARSGFVRVSEIDPHYFETSDGAFFYPLGHVTRSPVDNRWLDNEATNFEPAHECAIQKTVAYDRWFQKMENNNENFCAVWMAPWWLGLEWTAIYPGYEGLGRYNQIHAAQLDHVMQSAERHGVYVLLFAMNHGQLSSVTDAEWESNPYKITKEGGLVQTASDFFTDEQCETRHRNKLRYILARWGYLTSLFGISLCSETEWVEPYQGLRCDRIEEFVDGNAKPDYQIPQKKGVVNDWLKRMSSYIRQNDAHGHLVTTQFSKIYNGRDLWSLPEFDFVVNNCYENAFDDLASDVEVRGGIAEAILGWSRRHAQKDKPKIIGEWGGGHMRNSHGKLASDLHLGIWALGMTDCAGCTGFWWWNEIDNKNLYPFYKPLHKFFDGYDRRGKELKPSQAVVSLAVATEGRHEVSTATFVTHPSRLALALANETECFAYVYHKLMNSISADGIDDIRFERATNTYLTIPKILGAGWYRVEYWDTFDGNIIETHEEHLDAEQVGSRRLVVWPVQTDVAIKMTRIAEKSQ